MTTDCHIYRQEKNRMMRNWLPRVCSHMYPMLVAHDSSFHRHPYPSHFGFHLAFKKDPHLPSPLGSYGPHSSSVLETFSPSNQSQRNLLPDKPTNKSWSSSLISLSSCARACQESPLLRTPRSASNRWQEVRALPHITVGTDKEKHDLPALYQLGSHPEIDRWSANNKSNFITMDGLTSYNKT